MEIKGFQGLSLIDYPKRISCIVFTGGCNMRCPFCQNPELVDGSLKTYPEDEVLKNIEERQGFVSSVVITGGEPTIQPDLDNFCKRIKEQGFFVKIDTNGLLPDVLKNLIEHALIDYISLDIKSSFKNYNNACGKEIDVEKIKASLELLRDAELDYETRTTCVPGIITEMEIEEIVSSMPWVERFVLQQYRNLKTLNPDFEKIAPYPEEVITRFKSQAQMFIKNVFIRGI